MNNEHRRPEISTSGQAVNGSCSTVSMKTSLFEYSKVWMLDVLSLDNRIVKVTPVKKVVADTNLSGYMCTGWAKENALDIQCMAVLADMNDGTIYTDISVRFPTRSYRNMQ